MLDMSSRNPAITPVLTAALVSATTPSCARNVSCWSTSGTVASLCGWRLTQTMFATGVMARLGLSTAGLWLKWMSTVLFLIWRPLSATWICCGPVGAVIVPLALSISFANTTHRILNKITAFFEAAFLENCLCQISLKFVFKWPDW